MSIHGASHSTSSPRAASPGAVAPGSDVPRPSGPTTGPAVSVRGLTKRYYAGVPGCSARVEALRGVDLDVGTGEALGVLGPAGAGKSTLLLCLAGLLRADEGTISWFGRPADDAGHPPGIVYVAERAAHYEFMTVREALEYHAVLRDIGGSSRGALLEETLEQAGLAAVASTRIGLLPWSIGPRLALAQALMAKPRMLLVDETLSGLDSALRGDVARMLRSLIVRGVTTILTTDTLDALEGVVPRVIVMTGGRITEPIDIGSLRRSEVLELAVATPALARRVFGARVAEEWHDRHVLRLPLAGTTPEEILARCSASGIRVVSSRVLAARSGDVGSVPDGTGCETSSDAPC